MPLDKALGRVLALDVLAEGDVPAFDRSNVDGYALRAEETYRRLGRVAPSPRPQSRGDRDRGRPARKRDAPDTATTIATGGMVPRGADSVLMVEHARVADQELVISRPVAPGANVSFAGTDMAKGELVLRRGTRLTHARDGRAGGDRSRRGLGRPETTSGDPLHG